MKRIPFLMILCLFAAFSAARAEPLLKLEELDGELLTFTISWSGVPAAEATLGAKVTGPDSLKITSTAKSLSVVDFVYPVDTRIESDIMISKAQPKRYFKGGREGWGKQFDRRIDFNYKEGQSFYYRDEKLRKNMPFEPGVQDPLSCFYLYRISAIGEDGHFKFRVNDGTAIIDSSVDVIGKETITVPAGTFNTLVVRPNMEGVGGVFAKSPGATLTMWLTDDKWRRPVKMYSKVKVGSFTAELEKISPPGGTRPALEPGKETTPGGKP